MRKFYLVLFVAVSFFGMAQIRPYTWQDHLSFNYANSISRLGSYIYASNYNGLLKIESSEYSTQRLNKINGLSDVGINLLRTNFALNKMLVIYENSNIDVIDANGNISNYPDIKLKTLSAKKTINEAYFNGKYAYLACGFGIVKFDMEKLEVTDTYIIGAAGAYLEVYQVAMNDSLIFAATPNGLYKANFTNQILNNYASWTHASPLPTGAYCGVIRVQNQILAAYAPSKLNGSITTKDTLYVLGTTNTWAKHFVNERLIKRLGHVTGNCFTLYGVFGPQVYDNAATIMRAYLTTFNGANNYPLDVYFEYKNASDIVFWIADAIKGIYYTQAQYPFDVQTQIKEDGTQTYNLSDIDVFEGKVAVAPSYPKETGGTAFLQEGLYVKTEGTWQNLLFKDFSNNTIFDINSVCWDRKDRTRVFASSWSTGLLEYKDFNLVKIYNGSNTTMGEVTPGTPRCSGLSMDKDGNLWMANSDTKEFLSVLKRNGEFLTFNFETPKFVRRILADRNNNIWVLHEREQGITVYKGSSFATPQLNVNFKVLSKNAGSGNLESNSVYSIAEDKDGKIWVGTEAGLRVFYNPEGIFSGSGIDGQPIKIIQDGNVELLLDAETVTSICVDGGNNKWVGTQSGGLYCFSPDGLKQLYHFTVDNSPIYSDFVIDLSYNEETGDIFIGTNRGLQSFRSLIIEGSEQFDKVYSYPNPVKPGYTGSVFVRGLMDNSVVKITDEAGNLTWETKSQGGQIEWPVKNLSGARASTGVYIIYAATTDGEFKAMSKVMVVN